MVMPGMNVNAKPPSSLLVRIIRMIPLMLLVLVAYFAVAMFSDDDALLTTFTSSLFDVTLPSGGKWDFTLEHLFIGTALIFLFFELVKSTSIGGAAIAEMAISTLVFVIFLVSFLIVEDASTSLFFILMMISFIDVLAGYIIGIKVARRDFSVG